MEDNKRLPGYPDYDIYKTLEVLRAWYDNAKKDIQAAFDPDLQEAFTGVYLDFWEVNNLLCEVYARDVFQDPATSPRAMPEAEDVKRVMNIIESDPGLSLRISLLRERIRRGEDLTDILLTIGYNIAKHEEIERNNEDNEN